MHCAQGSMSQAEVNHALKQFIFECIQVTITLKKSLPAIISIQKRHFELVISLNLTCIFI